MHAYDLIAWSGGRSVAERVTQRGGTAQLGADPHPDGLLDLEPPPATLVKSPGVPMSAPPVAAALERGLPVLDELELGWRSDRRPLVGVTGTNGKSTCALVVEFLNRAGSPALLAGNTTFGPP